MSTEATQGGEEKVDEAEHEHADARRLISASVASKGIRRTHRLDEGTQVRDQHTSMKGDRDAPAGAAEASGDELEELGEKSTAQIQSAEAALRRQSGRTFECSGATARQPCHAERHDFNEKKGALP